MGSKNFPAIGGIKIVDGKVRTSGSASRPLGLGPLAGGPARSLARRAIAGSGRQ